jgi:hypothetical protein
MSPETISFPIVTMTAVRGPICEASIGSGPIRSGA